MTKTDNGYQCDICKEPIAKGTGFSYPDPDYHTHQKCYYNKTKDAGDITGNKNSAKQNIKDAKELVKEYRSSNE